MNASKIFLTDRRQQGEVNGRWVIEADASEFHPAGTLVCDPAPNGTDWSLTFTADNGKVYWDTPEHCQWTPRC